MLSFALVVLKDKLASLGLGKLVLSLESLVMALAVSPYLRPWSMVVLLNVWLW